MNLKISCYCITSQLGPNCTPTPNTKVVITFPFILFGGEIMSSKVVALSLPDDEYGSCDESKCASIGLAYLFGYSFTCYTDDILFPMICSHGHIPRIVETEPGINSTFRLGAFPKIQKTEPLILGGNNIDLASYQYYTCCPPYLPLDVNINRHCTNSSSSIFDASNSLENDDQNENSLIVCEDESRPYHRNMENYGARESNMCCDSNIDQSNNTINDFLDVTECVPFRNENYMPSWAGDVYGHIFPISCNNKGIYSEFQFPRLVEKTNPYGIQYYKCCKTGSKTDPYVHNNSFKITVYPQIAVSAVAVLSLFILITALIIPLCLHVLRGNGDLTKNNTTSNTSSSQYSSQIISSEKRPTLTEHPTTGSYRRSSQGSIQTPFSGYNLYLVYLAIPDIILNIYLLGMYSACANQKYNPEFSGVIIQDLTYAPFEGAFVIACSSANLYLNCVISYEVLILVRNSYNALLYDPPSLWKVTMQSVLVYVVAILIFITHYLIGRSQLKSFQNGNFERSIQVKNINFYWSLVVTYISPIVFFSYVWVIIWYRGYMPSSTGRMRQLVWYFLRIFVVFYGIWLPGMGLLVAGAAKQYEYANLICIGYLFCVIQPIVSTCMAMSKSDVRQYTLDVITLSYFRK